MTSFRRQSGYYGGTSSSLVVAEQVCFLRGRNGCEGAEEKPDSARGEDGPLAGRTAPGGEGFAANSAWSVCVMIAHNLLRAADSLDPDRPAGPPCAGRSSTSPARPQRRAVLHLPEHWPPWARRWLAIWHGVFNTHPPPATA